MSELSGDWDSRKNHCSFGYKAVWEISEIGHDQLTVKEKPGAHCCFFVPNCILKTHHMEKVEENKWQGTSGCKTVSITKISDTELAHMTTDGLCTLTRRQQ